MLSLSLAYIRIFFVQEMKFPYIKDISHTEKMRVKLSSIFFEYETDIPFNTIYPESKISELSNYRSAFEIADILSQGFQPVRITFYGFMLTARWLINNNKKLI